MARRGDSGGEQVAAKPRKAAHAPAGRSKPAKSKPAAAKPDSGKPGAARRSSRTTEKPNGKAASQNHAAPRWRRWLRRALIVLVLVALLPFGLAALYAVPGIHPVSTLMLADTLRGREVEREWTPLENMPPALVASVLASEDARFCAHRGVDWGALAEVTRDALSGERARGASTITMQTVKNLFLPPSRSILRKAAEVPLALWADLVWGKRRTLEIYLNIAEWAPDHYGAAAGARTWFGKDVGRLTRAEAARLAVTLPNPYVRNPADPGPRVSALARVNQKRAGEMGPYLGCLEE